MVGGGLDEVLRDFGIGGDALQLTRFQKAIDGLLPGLPTHLVLFRRGLFQTTSFGPVRTC